MKKRLLTNDPIRSADFSMLGIVQRIGFLPDKIALFDTIEDMGIDGYLRLQVAVLVLVVKGTCRAEIDLKEWEIREHGVLIVFPGQVCRIIEISKDFKPLCVAASQNMVEELTVQMTDALRIKILAKDTPYFQLMPSEFGQLETTYRLLQTKMTTTEGNPCRLSVLKNMLLALAYECLGFRAINLRASSPTSRKKSLFDAFIKKVTEKHQKEHGVKYYAKILCVTPKYLATVVEEMSGKSAKRWIDEFIALDAKVLLRSSEKDIQEIAYELNFIDISFFGKFFKRMTGVSPKSYRQEEN